MESFPGIEAMDFGIAVAILIVVHRGLSLASQLYASKKLPAMACQHDPKHFQRIKDIHEMTLMTEDQKKSGAFKCQFKDRDEVRDLIEMMRQNVQATRDLTNELRLTRNGNGSKQRP